MPSRIVTTSLHRWSRRGAVAVEFALSLPVLVPLTAGLIDWGEFFSGQLVLESAVRDAARSGIHSATPAATATTRVRSALTASGLDGSAATVSATVSTDATLNLSVLKLIVSVPHTTALGLVTTPSSFRSEMTVLLEPP